MDIVQVSTWRIEVSKSARVSPMPKKIQTEKIQEIALITRYGLDGLWIQKLRAQTMLCIPTGLSIIALSMLQPKMTYNGGSTLHFYSTLYPKIYEPQSVGLLRPGFLRELGSHRKILCVDYLKTTLRWESNKITSDHHPKIASTT